MTVASAACPNDFFTFNPDLLQAGLKFITHHALLFRAHILSDASELFARLLVCLYARQKRVSYNAPDACAAVLVQVWLKYFAAAVLVCARNQHPMC